MDRRALAGVPGPVLANVKIVPEALPLVFPKTFDGAAAINTFCAAATA